MFGKEFMRRAKPIAFVALSLLIGVAIGYGLSQSLSRTRYSESRFYEVVTVTYDGEQYYTEAYVGATEELRRWLSEEAGADLRLNVLAVSVYPSGGSGMTVGCELGEYNDEQLILLSQKAGSILYQSPRRPALKSTTWNNKADIATPNQQPD